MSTSAEKQNIFNSMSFQMNSIKVFPFDHSVVNITHEFHISYFIGDRNPSNSFIETVDRA